MDSLLVYLLMRNKEKMWFGGTTVSLFSQPLNYLRHIFVQHTHPVVRSF